jgi:hypothetical protein
MTLHEWRFVALICTVPTRPASGYRALREAASADRVAPVVVEREAVLTSLRSNDGNPSYDRRAYAA